MVLMFAAARPADACPPGPCNKYRHIEPDRLMQAEAVGYTRQITARLPRFTRARIAQLLTGSIWDPVYASSPNPNVRMVPPPSIRFVEARSVRRAPVRSNVRTVLVRRIEVRGREAWIEVDGAVFVLERCDADLPDACLNLRSDLSFDDLDADTEFAKPPR